MESFSLKPIEKAKISCARKLFNEISKDVHEPIIARNDFEKVQTLIAKTKRRAPKPKNGEKSIFCDLLYCGDCHGKLRHHTNTINKDIHYFMCANNKVDYRGKLYSKKGLFKE